MFELVGYEGVAFLVFIILGTNIYASLRMPDSILASDGGTRATLITCGLTVAVLFLGFFILWIAGIGGFFIIAIAFPLAIFKIMKKINSQKNLDNQ